MGLHRRAGVRQRKFDIAGSSRPQDLCRLWNRTWETNFASVLDVKRAVIVLTVTHIHRNIIRVRTMRATIHPVGLRRRFLRRREGWYWLQSMFVSDTGIFQGGPSSPTIDISAFIYNHAIPSFSSTYLPFTPTA